MRIYNSQALEKRILQNGAKLTDQTSFVDTYFNQPSGNVLKIVEKNKGAFLNTFQAADGRFNVVKDERVNNPGKLKKQYASQYGIKRIMKGKRKFFEFKYYLLTFNLIDNVGDFLIVTGENPSTEFVKNELFIKNPEYITVSFDEVKMT